MSTHAAQPRLSLARLARRGAGLRARIGVPALVRREPLLFALTAAAAVAYAVYSLWEHRHFQTEYDLAIFDQAIWHYSRLENPWSTIITPERSVLGDHFTPILALLGPLYWVWADPRGLLVAQAILIAASIVPVFLYARPRMGRVGAYLLAAGYALFWGFASGVAYQFHELAFAPLLIALCILLADRERWRAFFVCLALLLLVKENMSVLVVFLGLWLMTRSEYRRGLIAAGAGAAWYLLATQVLVPAFGGDAGSYWTYEAFGDNVPEAVESVIRHPGLPFHELIDDGTKVRTLAYLFVPFLLLVLYSPLVLLCVPLVAQQLFSSNTQYWTTHYHYWLPIAPVLAMGAADGFRNLVRLMRREVSLAWMGVLAGGLILFANLQIAKRYPLWSLTKSEFSFEATPDDRVYERLVDAVPKDASVTTSANLLPHLAQRDAVYLLGQSPTHPVTEYVIYAPGALGWPNPAVGQAWLDRHARRYRRVRLDSGWAILRRR